MSNGNNNDSGKVRLKIIVEGSEDETLSDTAMRAKRLLVGMNAEAFQDVSIPRWAEEYQGK
jgi:hypothetical protein